MFRLGCAPRCRYAVWSKLVLELMAGRCWCWDQSFRSGECTELARSKKEGEGSLEGPPWC